MEVSALAKITEYLETVNDQIRWKRARQPLTRELETHLQEQCADCLCSGMDETAAEAEAIRQMGDPVQIGQELDRIHRPKPQWKLLLLVGLLAIFGAWLRLYTGSDAVRVIFYLIVGFFALFGVYLLDYTFFVRHARIVYVGMILLSILTLYRSPMYLGVSYYTRYLVLLYPLVYVLFLTTLRGRGWDGLLFSVVGGVPLLLITMAAPSVIGTLLFLISSFITLLTVIRSGWFQLSQRKTIWILCTAAIAVCCLICLYYGDALLRRLSIILYPEQDPHGYGYIATYIQELLAQADWFHLPTEEVPGNHQLLFRDYLPALLVIHTGWIPFLLLCAALLGLLIAAVIGCLRQKHQLGRLISLSIILTLGIQLLLSIPGNLGYIFLSAACPLIDGNFHTVLDMALIGILLSVFRQETLPLSSVCAADRSDNPKRIRWENGNLVISIAPK